MEFKKGDKFKLVLAEKVYVVAGKWSGEIVLSPAEPDDEVCFVYTKEEMKEFLRFRFFIKLD